MYNVNKKISCIAVLLGGTLLSTSAQAQMLDYTTFSEMFGEPVTASATGKPQRVSEVPISMEIITQEDIRRSGAVHIGEVIRKVNGVNVVQKTTNQYDISVRGYNQHVTPRLLVLVNGRQVYLDHYGYTSWSAVPIQLEEIQQIEVVKGPNTALFGFNAVSGVINIVTYNPLFDDKSSVGVTVGNNSHNQAHYVQSYLAENFGIRFSAGVVRSDDFENASNGPAFPANGYPNPRRRAFNVDAVYQTTDTSQVRVELSKSSTDEGGINSVASLNESDYKTQSFKVDYLNDSDWGLIKATVYKNYLDWTYNTTSKSGNQILVGQLEDVISINPQHTLRVSGEFRDNVLESNLIADNGGKVSYKVYAGGLMWDWKITDEITWTNAARVDYLKLGHNGVFDSTFSPNTLADYDQKTSEYSYNSGVVWKPTAEDTFRATTARGLEIPSLLEFGLDSSSATIALTGNPRLKPTVVTNYELGWDRRIEDFSADLRTAIFYQTSQDAKHLFGSRPPGQVLADNVGDSSAYGVEVSLEGRLNEKFDWGVGYIFEKISDKLINGESGNTLNIGREFEKFNPTHHLNVALGYQEGAWEGDLFGYFVSDSTQIGRIGSSYTLIDVDGYFGLNGRLAYKFEHDITVAVHGQQLQESQVQTSTTPDVDRRFFLSVSKKF